MGDWLPVVSQVKSFVQWVGRDAEGARRTQENFTRQCPIVSQFRSAVEAIAGDDEAALETQRQCGKMLLGVVDGTPGVGHLKGAIHYVCGDREGGDEAMKAASRTTGVMGGAAGGFFLGGPAGAVAGGIAGGAAMDGITTGIDSAVHQEYRPYGHVANVTNIIKEPTNPGHYFDAALMPVMDGFAGKQMGEAIGKNIGKPGARKLKTQLNKKIGRETAHKVVEHADFAREKHIINKPQVLSVVEDDAANAKYVGRNRRARQAVRQHQGMSKNQARKPRNFKGKYNKDPKLNEAIPSKVQDKAGKTHGHPNYNRDPRTCAEQHAYEKYYQKNPHGQYKKTKMSTFKRDTAGNVKAIKRCDNCVYYADGMGEVLTDKIDGCEIPSRKDLTGFYFSPNVEYAMAAVLHQTTYKDLDEESDSDDTDEESDIEDSDDESDIEDSDDETCSEDTDEENDIEDSDDETYSGDTDEESDIEDSDNETYSEDTDEESNIEGSDEENYNKDTDEESYSDN